MSYDKENIFAKILRGEIPCDKIYEDEYVLSFKDISPQAKTHVLIIPKDPYIDVADFLQNADTQYQNNFWQSVNKIIDCLELRSKGFQIKTHKEKMEDKRSFISIYIF